MRTPFNDMRVDSFHGLVRRLRPDKYAAIESPEGRALRPRPRGFHGASVFEQCSPPEEMRHSDALPLPCVALGGMVNQ
jgi:hypothetical protein